MTRQELARRGLALAATEPDPDFRADIMTRVQELQREALHLQFQAVQREAALRMAAAAFGPMLPFAQAMGFAPR